MPDRFLNLDQVSVVYGQAGAQTLALREVSLEFPRARLSLVIGPSGSGKTTLLSLLGCLLVPDRGSVYVIGEEVNRLSETARTRIRQRHIGYVFQAFRLLSTLSALDNVAIAHEIGGGGNGRELARHLLWQFGMEDKAALKPDELSGGEKQRVALARAMIKKPAILLADEPTASLDSRAGAMIMQVLTRLAEEDGRTVVVVSHDPRWEEFAHRIVILRDGEVAGEKRVRE